MAQRIAVVTDSNSGITQKLAKELGVFVLPMPFVINGETFFEDISLSQEAFYEKLQSDAAISTSQPAPGDILDLWDTLLQDHDAVVHIPMSSGLSGSCAAASALAAEYDGRVAVVNNQRISVTQRQSVMDAAALARAGKSAAEIKEVLEKVKFESSIYIMVDTLQYLKKGGRITPAAAAVATVLRIKPVLQIQGEKLDAFAKAGCESAGVVTGYGMVNGGSVFAFSQDSSVAGGAVSAATGAKIAKVYEMAAKVGVPVVGIYDSKGACIAENSEVLVAYGEMLQRSAALSGVVPQIAVIAGV